MIQGLLSGLGYQRAAGTQWLLTRDGDRVIFALSRTHYSITNKRPKVRQFIGPGEKIVLLHESGLAAFAWRRSIDYSGQRGVNNCIFINRGAGLSSQLILEAEQIAWQRWPHERLYTYVNPSKIRSTNPGYCYLMAGWQRAGFTRKGLLVLEKFGAASSAAPGGKHER